MYETNEHLLDELVRFYALPSVSIRDVLWHEMKANRTFHGLGLRDIYYDRIHPSDAGHSILSQALVHLFKRAALSAELDALAGAALRLRCAAADAAAPLPPPIHADGEARMHGDCLDAPRLSGIVHRDACDWAFVTELSRSGQPKPGWQANTSGARCDFSYPITARGSEAHRVGVGFLKSYQHMGKVKITCFADCACAPLVLDAHHDARYSPYDLSWFGATPTGQGRCGVRLTVLDETSSGEHKFKLTALFLNQLGGKDMFGGWTAKNALFSKEEAAKREAKEAAKPTA